MEQKWKFVHGREIVLQMRTTILSWTQIWIKHEYVIICALFSPNYSIQTNLFTIFDTKLFYRILFKVQTIFLKVFC